MSRGPKPAPEGVVAQKETVRSKRTKKIAAVAPEQVGGITAPDWLKDEGLAIWKRQAPFLTSAKLLTPADQNAFARYCRNFARWLKMQAILDASVETYSVTTASGTVHRVRPEFMIADRLERQLIAAEDRFGLNPAERQRIMAARAQSGVSGDLFANQPAPQRPVGDPAAKPAVPAKPIPGPVGLLMN